MGNKPMENRNSDSYHEVGYSQDIPPKRMQKTKNKQSIDEKKGNGEYIKEVPLISFIFLFIAHCFRYLCHLYTPPSECSPELCRKYSRFLYKCQSQQRRTLK